MPDFTRNPASHPLLSRPINVYSIPPELLDLLTVRSVTNTGALQIITPAFAQDQDQDNADVDEEKAIGTRTQTQGTETEKEVVLETGSSLTCQTCLGATFPTLEDQRAHFKSDWHRYNVRVSINHKGNSKGSLQGKGGVPRGVLTEEEFEEVDDGVSSLSGSASDTSASSHSPSTPASASGISTTDRITKLVRRAQLQPLSSTSRSQTPTGGNDADGTSGDMGADLDSDEEAEQNEYRRRAELRTAVVWYGVRKDSHPDPATQAQAQHQGQHQQQTLVPVDTQLGVHRALLPPGLSDPSTFLPALRSIQLPYKSSSTGHDFNFDQENPNAERKLTLLMVAGGHFAGMVVALKPLSLGQGKGGKAERQDVKGAGEIRVLRHKTFHRYTTRKKQGGSQALNDNAKSKANSAGAMLRRYGEQSLQEEIQRLMIEWADEVRTSEKIFLRASTAGKRSFWGYEGAVLEKGDERVVTFPFPTRRPTLAELFRCYHELTRVKITHLSDEAILALEQAYIASLQPKTRPIPTQSHTPQIKEKEIKPKLSPEEESYRERRNRLVDMVRKGRLEPLQAFWAKHGETFGGVDAVVEEWAEEGSGMTLLMIASQAGQEDVTRWLLEDLRADPTLTLGGGGGEEVKEADEQDPAADPPASTTTMITKGRGRTAYDLTASKPVRNVFRRLAHDHPEWHDWIGAAHVPSGLSEEKELEQEKKKADRRKGMREKAKEREAKRPVEVAAPEPVAAAPTPAKPLTGPQKLGGGRPGGDTSSLAGLTPEMRQRIERERRARAAEARLTGK